MPRPIPAKSAREKSRLNKDRIVEERREATRIKKQKDLSDNAAYIQEFVNIFLNEVGKKIDQAIDEGENNSYTDLYTKSPLPEVVAVAMRDRIRNSLRELGYAPVTVAAEPSRHGNLAYHMTCSLYW